jgi:hypothetical protein
MARGNAASQRADAALGVAVRRALDAGRAKRIANAKQRGAASAALVADLAMLDLAAGRPERGRAGRIARKLHGELSESRVRKILRAFSNATDSTASNGVVDSAGDHLERAA